MLLRLLVDEINFYWGKKDGSLRGRFIIRLALKPPVHTNRNFFSAHFLDQRKPNHTQVSLNLIFPTLKGWNSVFESLKSNKNEGLYNVLMDWKNVKISPKIWRHICRCSPAALVCFPGVKHSKKKSGNWCTHADNYPINVSSLMRKLPHSHNSL